MKKVLSFVAIICLCFCCLCGCDKQIPNDIYLVRAETYQKNDTTNYAFLFNYEYNQKDVLPFVSLKVAAYFDDDPEKKMHSYLYLDGRRDFYDNVSCITPNTSFTVGCITDYGYIYKDIHQYKKLTIKIMLRAYSDSLHPDSYDVIIAMKTFSLSRIFKQIENE